MAQARPFNKPDARSRSVVAMIVFNGVSHDARVLKEARALAGVGRRVTIIGVAARREEHCLPGGVRVRTVALHSPLRITLRWLPRLLAAGLLLTAAILFHPAWWITAGLGLLAASVLVGRRSLLAWPVIRQIKNRLWLALLGRQMLAELRAIAPGIIHCHDAGTLPIGHAYRQRHGGVLIYDSHEIAEHQQGESDRRRIEVLQERVSVDVAGFITVNDHIAAYLNQKYPRLPAATVVRNATPLPETWEADDRLRRAASLPAGMKILLFQGGFARGRGLPALVQAVPHLPDDWAVVLMGWGSLEAELRGLANALPRRRDAVRFLPGVPQGELRLWTAGAAVGVIPYENTCLNHWLCSPNKLWEYPSAGVPILASAFPVLSEVIEEHGIGWLLADPADPHAIAAAIGGLTDADLDEKRGNCRRFLERDNWSIYAARLLELYQRLDGVAA